MNESADTVVRVVNTRRRLRAAGNLQLATALSITLQEDQTLSFAIGAPQSINTP